MMDFIWLASYRKRQMERRTPRPPGLREARPQRTPDEGVRGSMNMLPRALFNLFNSFWISSMSYKQFQQLTKNYALEAIPG
jgi:hypothetical protein